MSIKTQGTNLYAMDPVDGVIIDVGCFEDIDGIDTAIDQIETTCLRNSERTYLAGLGTPGTATFTIQTDPQNPDHLQLFDLKQAGTTLKWAIGWSEDVDVPPTSVLGTDTEYEFVFPESRSWLTFEGYMSAFPFSFAANSVVKSQIGVQVSGGIAIVPAAP